MQSQAEIRSMLEERGLAPRKSLGQNFLIDHNLIRKLVDASGVGPGDSVLEIGPGTGALTDLLLERGADVVACELDRGLAELLRQRFAGEQRFTLVEGDCLFKRRALADAVAATLPERFSLVANLPYGAASPLLSSLLIGHDDCRGVWVTIQREVGERLCARPSTRAYGTLSVLAQLRGDPSRIATLAPSCFWPRPDVTSAMIGLEFSRPRVRNMQGLAQFLQRLFQSRRKQLSSVLGSDFPWPGGCEPSLRAEALEPGALVELFLASTSG